MHPMNTMRVSLKTKQVYIWRHKIMCKGNGNNGHIQPEVKETHVRNTEGRCEIFDCDCELF